MARGPQFHQMVKATMAAATAALLLQVAPPTALAGEGSSTRISRSTAPTQGYSDDGSTTPVDGFAAGAMARDVKVESGIDGWANRSTPSISRDGWEVAGIELPEPATVTDGWAYRSGHSDVNLASLDGWAYGSVTGSEDLSQVPSSPAPPRETTPPFAEIALAATLALIAAAGAGFVHRRHQHHLPV